METIWGTFTASGSAESLSLVFHDSTVSALSRNPGLEAPAHAEPQTGNRYRQQNVRRIVISADDRRHGDRERDPEEDRSRPGLHSKKHERRRDGRRDVGAWKRDGPDAGAIQNHTIERSQLRRGHRESIVVRHHAWWQRPHEQGGGEAHV